MKHYIKCVTVDFKFLSSVLPGAVTEERHWPPGRPPSASTRRSVRTSSQRWRRGWEPWCWGSESWVTSGVSQTYTPTPETTQDKDRWRSLTECVSETWHVTWQEKGWWRTVRFMCSSSLLRASSSPPGNFSSPGAAVSSQSSPSGGIPYSSSWFSV